MTQKELIKWAKNNLQEVQKLKEKKDQEKEIQECGFFLTVNQALTKN